MSTLLAIFRNNADLCENVSEALIAHVVGLVEHKQRNAIFLEFLQVIVSSCEKELDGCQIKVVEEVSVQCDETIVYTICCIAPTHQREQQKVA